jgi:hypothetical protein
MRTYILLSVALAASLALRSQTTVLSVGGATALTIKSGTLFSADSLVLTPTADLTLSSNTLTRSATAVQIAPHPSIDRIYTFSSQLTYTGNIKIYYNPATELNGNTESTLEYTDSATGSVWLPSATSTVNTASHFVQQVLSAHPFIGATASGTGITLPLSLISFTGSWQGNSIPLQWTVEQTSDPVNFKVYSSTDASAWQPIATVPGVPSAGQYTYDYTDFTPGGNPMFYRLALQQQSGATTWSGVVTVHKPGNSDNTLRLLTDNSSAHAYFDGTAPSAIRVVNSAGQVLHTDNTSRVRYDLTGLAAGVYFLQYQLNGQWSAREFLIP